jgi:hypothetical protein
MPGAPPEPKVASVADQPPWNFRRCRCLLALSRHPDRAPSATRDLSALVPHFLLFLEFALGARSQNENCCKMLQKKSRLEMLRDDCFVDSAISNRGLRY